MRSRKKPVVIGAIKWEGDNQYEVEQFVGKKLNFGRSPDYLVIETLEGNHEADLGDMIIKGVKNEFYSCKPDIFKMTYEKVKK